jgi:hypothetical protein
MFIYIIYLFIAIPSCLDDGKYELTINVPHLGEYLQK